MNSNSNYMRFQGLLHLIVFLTVSLSLSAQCFQDRHNTSADEAWLSCVPSMSPNPERGVSHWIMYDLGEGQELGESVVWNYNTPGLETNGIQELAVDYSIDGLTWETYGSHIFSQTAASSFNQGVPGPDLSGIGARYILLTAVSNFGGDCYGMAEIRINVGDIISNTIETAIADFSLDAVPNPASDALTLKFDNKSKFNCNLSLANSLGQLVFTEKLTIQPGSTSKEIDISTLSPGLYIISVQERNSITSSEVIITK